MLSKYIERINQVYPYLPIKDYHTNDIGQNNYVIVVNHSFVFRFPKYNKGIERLKEEAAILDIVGDFVSISIPKIKYQSFEEPEVGEVFIGYALIEGVPFWGKSLYKIKDKKLKMDLAQQLVTFLLELHSISHKDLAGIALKDNDPYLEMYQLYRKIKEKLFPFIRTEAQKAISFSFEQFLSNNTDSNKKTTLIHGDFGSSNILWDPNINKITGIIDFGGARLGDPAYDFAGILSSFGKDFFNMCISIYPNGTEISERVKFYKSTFALQEALHGIENDDRQAFEDGIKNFR
ncbi:phosphotransferase family protein [Heyndrickxia sporothermodurans]